MNLKDYILPSQGIIHRPAMTSMALGPPRATCFLITFFMLLQSLTSGVDVSQFIYAGFRWDNLRLEGYADIHVNGLLQLTNNSLHQAGYAFHPIPLKFDKSHSFSTAFVFAIHPEMQHSGQGLTFVLSPSMNFGHAYPDEYLGLFNSTSNGAASNHIFAIELDTNQNLAFGDINSNHVGIDVNSLRSVDAAPAAYYSEKEGKNQSLLLASTKVMQLWVDYDDKEMLVNVTVAPIRVPKPSQRLLSTPVNLSEVLLDSMYAGFSASTALLKCNHYIFGWSWNQSGLAQSLDSSTLPSIPKFRTRKRPDKVFLGLLTTILFVLVAVLASLYAIQKRKYNEVQEDWEKDCATCRFSYKDLYKATKGFKSTEFLGAGGFGKVYKGVLRTHDNLQVAVKRVSHESEQGVKAFVAEIVSMRSLSHRNLVRLLGYCRRRGELLLVYDYMPNGSLDKYLFGNEKPSIGWNQRFKIIREVASALVYLHEESSQTILHRDVKASNVLLDEHMNARLGDFGLARIYDHGTNPQTTHVVGTAGYLAPEFAKTGKATPSSDVFSFGAFVLEVACGRTPLEADQGLYRGDNEDLVEWVFNKWKRGLILSTSDPKLAGSYNPEEMEVVLQIGLLCSHFKPDARPSMRQTVQYLHGAMTLPDIPPDFGEVGGIVDMEGDGWGMSSSSASASASLQKSLSASLYLCDSIL